MSSMNLRQVECFLAVAHELHFARAAERLNLSPASVSEAIAALERRVGGPLFDRSTRKVRLTAHGASFLDAVQEPYEQLQRAHEAARARARRGSEIVLAHTPELGHLLLPPLLARAVEDKAAVASWRPALMHTPDQLAAIENGRVDLGLCWSASVHSPLVSTVLGVVPLVAILRPSDPLAGHDEIPLSALRARALLMTPRADNPFVESLIHSELVHGGVPDAAIDEVERYDEMIVQVASGNRIGLHPATIAVTNRISGVVFRPLVDPGIRVTICAVLRQDRKVLIEPVIRALTDIVDGLDLARIRT